MPLDEKLGSIKVYLTNAIDKSNDWIKVSTHSKKTTQQQLSSTTINAGETKNVDLPVPEGKTGVAVTLKATYDASATAGAKIEAFYSPDGTNYDTDTDDSYNHPFTAGETKQKTYIFPAIHPYIRIAVTNLDANYSMTVDLWVTFI